MSEDFVNNITLNYLISKTQLNKLNKAKQVKENHVKNEKELYKEQIMGLFCELLEKDSSSVNVLQEVKNGFDYFIEKTIYHIKMKKMTEEQEENRNKNETITVTKSKSSSSCDDNNVVEHLEDDEDAEDDDEDEDDEDYDEDEEDEDEEDDSYSETNLKKYYNLNEENSNDNNYNAKQNVCHISNNDNPVSNDVFHNSSRDLEKKEKETVVYKKYPDKFNWFNMAKNEKKSNKIVPRVK